MKLSKSDILKIPHNKVFGFDEVKDFRISGVSLDSRSVKAGELFLAIRGDQFDGHNFISKAIEAGAVGIIVERRWAESNEAMMVSIYVPRIVVENTVCALGHLANSYRRKFDIPIIAIGGSNGKTTTKDMLKNVLGRKYRILCTEGNLNNHIGVPQTLFRLEKNHEAAVVEIGTNHHGEIEYLCSILEPTHGLITNIGREHLEFFGTIEGVAKAENELFDWLVLHHGTAFVNADDIYLARSSKKLKKVIRYGFSTRSTGIKGTVKSLNQHAHPLLQIKPQGKKSFECLVGVPGEHNAKNALAAAAVGFTMKVPPADIQKALASFPSSNKRMQVQRIAKVTILNDTYNANPDSTLAALATLHAMRTKGKKIAILADMLELGPHASELHEQIGKILSQYGINLLLTFGPLSKSLHDTALVETKAHFESKAALTEYLVHAMRDGDIVLIKGSRGMKMEDVVTSIAERHY